MLLKPHIPDNMKIKKTTESRLAFLLLAATMPLATQAASEKIILLNEGSWQADNGRITYFEDGQIVSNEWFRLVNGSRLGDTPEDIIRVNDNLLAISVNWSNIVQFISPDGKAVAATEDIPNNRKLATDGHYVYVTSYGHECSTASGLRKFTKGFVAKIDVATFSVTDAVEVGYEPEGIAYYDGHLFVANTGGYAFQEDHDYEQTISVIDADTMEVVRLIDTGQINLYGEMSQSGPYLCVSSPGDNYDVEAATIILDCRRALEGYEDCFQTLDYAATYNTTDTQGRFLAIGSRYSYYTGEYTFNCITIDPEEVMVSGGSDGVTETLPGTMAEDILAMKMPYGIYVNPFTGYLYATDAGSFTSAGSLLQWDPDGMFLGSHKVYINPSHFLALPPDCNNSATVTTDEDADTGLWFDIEGRRVTHPNENGILIKNGKKVLFTK